MEKFGNETGVCIEDTMLLVFLLPVNLVNTGLLVTFVSSNGQHHFENAANGKAHLEPIFSMVFY